MEVPDAPLGGPAAPSGTGEPSGAQHRVGADAPQPQPDEPTGAEWQTGAESSADDYAPSPPREFPSVALPPRLSPLASPCGPSMARTSPSGRDEAPEQIPDHSDGRAVALGGDAATVEVEEITRMLPCSGPEEVEEPVQVGRSGCLTRSLTFRAWSR